MEGWVGESMEGLVEDWMGGRKGGWNNGWNNGWMEGSRVDG